MSKTIQPTSSMPNLAQTMAPKVSFTILNKENSVEKSPPTTNNVAAAESLKVVSLADMDIIREDEEQAIEMKPTRKLSSSTPSKVEQQPATHEQHVDQSV